MGRLVLTGGTPAAASGLSGGTLLELAIETADSFGSTSVQMASVASATPTYFGVGGAIPHRWITDPLPKAVTISAAPVPHLLAFENNAKANQQIGLYLYRCDANGNILSTIINGATRGVELGATVADQTWTPAFTTTTVAVGERILLAPFCVQIGTGATGYVNQLNYGIPSAGQEATACRIEFSGVLFVDAPATYDLDSYRFRNDDGTETSATWRQAVNVADAIPKAQKFRLRIAMEGVSSDLMGYIPQFRRKPIATGVWGAWTDCGASGDTGTPVVLQASSNGAVTNNMYTTRQIWPDATNYQDGYVQNVAGSYQLADYTSPWKTEWEWVFYMPSGAVVNGDVIEIRLVTDLAHDPFPVYTNTPSLTVGSVVPSTPITLSATVTPAAALALAPKKARTLAVTLTPLLVVQKRVSRSPAASLVLTPALASNKKLQRAIALGITLTADDQMRVSRALAAGATLTPALVKTTGPTSRTLAASLVPVPALSDIVYKRLALAAGPVLGSALQKRVGRSLAATTTLTVADQLRISRTLPVGLTVTPALVSRALLYRALSAAPILGVAFTLGKGKGLSAGLTPVLALQKRVGRTLPAGLTLTPALSTRATRYLALAATPALAGSLMRRVSRSIAASAPITAQLSTLKSRTLAGTVTPALAIQKRVGRTLPAGLTIQAAQQDMSFRALAAGLVATPALNRRLSKAMSVGATLSNQIVLAAYKGQTLAASLVPQLGVQKRVGRTQPASLAATAALVDRAGRFLAAAASLGLTLQRRVSRSFSLGVTFSPSVTPLKSKYTTLSAATTFTPALARRKTGYQALAGSATFVPVLATKGKGTISLDAIVPYAITVRKMTTRSSAANLTLTAALVRAQVRKLTLSAAPTFSSTLAAQKARFTILNASVTLSPVLAKRVKFFMAVAAGVGTGTGIRRTLFRPAAAVVTMQNVLSKSITRTLGASTVLTAAFATKRIRPRQLSASVVLSGALVRRPARYLSAALASNLVIKRFTYRLLSGSVAMTPGISFAPVKRRQLDAVINFQVDLVAKSYVFTEEGVIGYIDHGYVGYPLDGASGRIYVDGKPTGGLGKERVKVGAIASETKGRIT